MSFRACTVLSVSISLKYFSLSGSVSLISVFFHFTEYGLALLLCASKCLRELLQYALDLADIMLVWESSRKSRERWELRNVFVGFNICDCDVHAESSELADRQHDVSNISIANTNDPATSSQNASEFDFNKFFPIDNVSTSAR